MMCTVRVGVGVRRLNTFMWCSDHISGPINIREHESPGKSGEHDMTIK
jgi:hypothetical protein